MLLLLLLFIYLLLLLLLLFLTMDNKLSIIQWNCQGLQAKYEALKILIHEHSPICISLQETMMGHRQALYPRDYVPYHIDYDEEGGSHGGSGLLIRQDISHASIPLQTDLQAGSSANISEKEIYSMFSLYTSRKQFKS